MKRWNQQQGFSLGAAAMATAAAALLILWLGNLLRSNSRQLGYLNAMERVYNVAESGLNMGLGILINEQGSCSDPTYFGVAHPGQLGDDTDYTNYCFTRISPRPNCNYIVTSASVTIGGRLYSQKLHSYALISNVSEYFAAVNGPMVITLGCDVSQGKVYARDLHFNLFGPLAAFTQVKRAEFYNLANLQPPLASPDYNFITGKIRISELAGVHLPIQLSAPLIFPQVTAPDLDNYKARAGALHIASGTFRGTDIFPPGYEGGQDALDTYANHENDNTKHIYYFEGDMHIGQRNSTTTIHGQILFIATGTIYIDGNVRSADPWVALPGAGSPSSSTAHQAVFMPGVNRDVQVSTNFYNVGLAGEQHQFLEGLILAPTGRFYANPYFRFDDPPPSRPPPFDNINNYVVFHFTGSMILGDGPDLTTAFGPLTTRKILSYMNTLKTNPPPFLPALSQLLNEFQEITTPGIYN